jgi:hypothetical protein
MPALEGELSAAAEQAHAGVVARLARLALQLQRRMQRA